MFVSNIENVVSCELNKDNFCFVIIMYKIIYYFLLFVRMLIDVIFVRVLFDMFY